MTSHSRRRTSAAPGSVCDMLRRQRVDVLDVAPLKSPVAFVGIMSAIPVLAMLMMVALVTGAIEDLSRFGPTLIDLGGAAADLLGWGLGIYATVLLGFYARIIAAVDKGTPGQASEARRSVAM
jgi:hypothetical protein